MKADVGFIGEAKMIEDIKKICEEFDYTHKRFENIDAADCKVLFALGLKKILKVEDIKKIPNGVIVIHFSKVPYYRGTYPLNQAIRHGEKEVGVSMIFVDEGIDTGNIIEQRALEVGINETIEELYGRCSKVALDMVRKNLKNIVEGTANKKIQTERGSLFNWKDFSNKIPLDLRINLKNFHNFVRSCTGKNQERAFLEDEKYKLYIVKTILERK